MRKIHLKFVSLIFVPLTGLFSCAQEKSNSVSDRFATGAPEIIRGDVVTSNAVEMATTKYMIDAKIRFPNLVGQNFNDAPVSIVTTTTCGDKTAENISVFSFRNVSEIRFQDLLPIDAFMQRDQKPETKNCSVSVVATNKIGSVHKYTIPTFQITFDPSTSDLVYSSETISEREADLPVYYPRDFTDLHFNFEGDLSRAKVHLLCQSFRTEATLSDIREIGFRALTRARIPYGEAHLEDAKKDPRQTCRFVVESAGENHKTQMSRYFQLQLDIAKPVVTADPKMFLNGHRFASRQPYLRVVVQLYIVTNPHGFPIQFAIEELAMNSLRVRPARGNGLYPERILNTRWNVGGGIFKRENNIVFAELKSNESMELTAYVGAEEIFPLLKAGMATPETLRDLSKITGFFYEPTLDAPVLILPNDSKFEAAPDLQNAERLTIIDMTAAKEGRPLRGWAPVTNPLPDLSNRGVGISRRASTQEPVGEFSYIN